MWQHAKLNTKISYKKGKSPDYDCYLLLLSCTCSMCPPQTWIVCALSGEILSFVLPSHAKPVRHVFCEHHIALYTLKHLSKHVFLSQIPRLSRRPGWSGKTTLTTTKSTFFFVKRTRTTTQRPIPGYQGLPEFVRYAGHWRRLSLRQRGSHIKRLLEVIAQSSLARLQ